MKTPRRVGFTLIELLIVMLLIGTVLGMGVPAMFAAERRSYVNQAMSELLRIHTICMAMQREAGARGLSGQIKITILQTAPPSYSPPVVKVESTDGTLETALNMSGRLGCTPSNPLTAMSINADGFVYSINATNPANFPASINWTYAQQTAFITPSTTMQLTFQALNTTTTTSGVFKLKRTVSIYPQGYSDIP